MKTSKKNMHHSVYYIGALTALLTSGCVVNQDAQKAIHESLMDPPPSYSPLPFPTTTPAPACFSDRFEQPPEQISHSVDILFVADTSGSMSPKRAKVADALYAFVGALPAGTDYRIGVILAHGSNDPDAGRLYTSSVSIPKVLDSAVLSQATIQSHLKRIMLLAPDYKYEEGEMGSYALLKALSPAKLAESRTLGFFRPDAALAIVTISDENDICAVYPNPLPTNFTLRAGYYATMPGMTPSENRVRTRDCPTGISTDQVIGAIKTLQGDRPFVIGAVIHPDVNYSDRGGNDSYGWGYADVVDQSHGVLVDIGDANFTSGLSRIGTLTSIKIHLLSEFTLNQLNVAPDTIHVLVDRNPVQFDYNVSQNEVHLFELGHARSEVEVSYCQKAVDPAPSPTVTVTPSPSPSVTPSPSPSPTGCTGPFCGGGIVGS